ncbi:MAG: uncharacterized protein QOI59_450 [Gammaproteobacteria bacterium]|jgi:uncharacterized lipoprotein YmbA|nr:uncharacterized protein [Gammaproteobacteria bacterium]
MHYYTLTETPAPSRLTAPDNMTPIRLDRVTIPTELDRSQIVRRLDSTQLQIVEADRWAAPLDETIRRILSNDLAARLPPGAVANPNEPSIGEKRQSLAVDIAEFYGDSACKVTLRAAWTLKQSDSQSLHGNEEATASPQGACTGAGPIPAAMSQALGVLSDQIAAAVSGPGVRRAQ